MKYKFIDHVADIAVEVYGNTIEELFENSALAWREAVVDGYESKQRSSKEISLNENSLEELLVNFISEINFIFHTKKWICNAVEKIEIKELNGYEMHVKLIGENFNSAHHNLKEEIKAVTFHKMLIKKEDEVFSTHIVFDI